MHGTKDDVVDVEHSYRLRKMLKLRDYNHEFSIIDGLGHGFKTLTEVNKFYSVVMPFLDGHLKKAEQVASTN